MWIDYIAAKIAHRYRGCMIAATIICAALITCEMCREMSRPPRGLDPDRARPDITISGPLGEYNIYGAKDWLEPIIEQGQMMNKIEAMENHAQWPTLSDRPEDYLEQ